MGLIEDIGAGPVGLDTAVFIYFIERHPAFVDLVREIFSDTAAGRLAAVTSAMTLLEVLVLPYRTGNAILAEGYEALLTRSRGLQVVDVDRVQLRAAAQLRARYAVKTPDALQVAAALSKGCTAFVTNDRAVPRMPGLCVLQLQDYSATD